MRLSCAEQMLGDRPLAEKVELAFAAGFDGIDLRWATLAEPANWRWLHEQRVPVGAIYSQVRDPGPLSAGARERAAALDLLAERAGAAAEIGAQNLIFVPIFGPAQIAAAAPLADAPAIERMLLLAELIELAGRVADVPISLTLEPLNRGETHLITDPAEAAAICAAVGSPRIATMVDTYHCDREGQDSAALVASLGDRLSLVHLSDRERRLPGAGGIAFGPIIAALRARGYAGWCGYECGPVEDLAALRRSVEHIRAL